MIKQIKWGLLAIILVCMAIPVRGETGFSALFAGQQTIENENAVAVTFSEALDSTQAFDTLMTIVDEKHNTAADGAWILARDRQVLYFTNIEPGTTYRIEVSGLLENHRHKKLEKAREFQVKTRETVPMVSFASSGFILPSALTKGLPVDTLNIETADIDFFRIKDEFLSEFFKEIGTSDHMFYYWSRDLSKYSDLVYSGRWDLDITENVRNRVNIRITHIEELKPPGVYFAVLKGAGHYEYRHSSTWFTISDIGLHARKYENRLQVNIQSIETAAPMEGVSVTAYSSSGRRIGHVTTDETGIAVIDGPLEKLKYMTARKGLHISLLLMDTPALDLSEFKIAPAEFRPVEFFTWGPRDLYRPGETVVINGLLRDHDGRMTPMVPLAGRVIRPDGRMIHEFTLKGRGLNHYSHEYGLPDNAITGTWRISFSQAGNHLKDYEFKVAEFLPERLKLDIETSDPQGPVISPEDDLDIPVKGDFLYGAPASGSKADAMIHIRPARELFPDKWPGFEFGDVTDAPESSFKTDPIHLDPEGRGKFHIPSRWESVKSPVWVTANVSLYESGGRPVVRNKSWQVWPAPQLVGIRLVSGDDDIEPDSVAEFEVTAIDSQGRRIGLDDLEVSVIKEHREYFWEYTHEAWQWRHTSQFYPVDHFSLSIPKDGTATVRVPVQWGGYRLEIKNPATGLISSIAIQAGWRYHGGPEDEKGGNRPDRVDIILDKPAYHPGQNAKVTLKSPEGGTGYLFVESDVPLFTLPVTIPPEGKTYTIPIDPGWQRHDLYVSALILRPGESRTGHLPRRSVGIAHLPLDRTSQKLSVKVEAPGKIIPGRTVEIPVTVETSGGQAPEQAFVTLAAVDVGILNLTGFKTPSAFDYFFRPRRYGIELHDLYQKLIETTDGTWASQRFGGDAPVLSRGGGRPVTDVQIVALHKKAIETDDRGTAIFKLDIPEFNGTLRLMAMAFTGDKFGDDDAEMTVASPVVTQLAMPRFLAMGDQSLLVLDIHNQSGETQAMALSMNTSDPVRMTGNPKHSITLGDNEKQQFSFPVETLQKTGRSTITCRLENVMVDGTLKTITRKWFLDTRPAFPGITRHFLQKIVPGRTFSMEPDDFNDFIPDTIQVWTSLDTTPPINLPAHIHKLFAYPYGCLEQVTSGIYPHVLLSGTDLGRMGVKARTDEKRGQKITEGIQRIMEKQKASGGFGLWDAQGPENFWLTAYVTDFLINAGQSGFPVPESALVKALDRLKTYIRRLDSIRAHAAVNQNYHSAAARAYAAMVLARVQGITLGDVRSVYHAILPDIKSPLAFTQIGIALYLAGDRSLAEKALEKALTSTRDDNSYFADYGSPARDAAFSYYLASRFYPDFTSRNQFLTTLQQALEQREFLSTQEKNALVMAGSIFLKASGKKWEADITSGTETVSVEQDRLFSFVSPADEVTGGFDITNTGLEDIFADITLTAYPKICPSPLSMGVKIQRRYLDMQGQKITVEQLVSGDLILVELLIKAEKNLANGLVVDLLPAGLSLEDPGLTDSTLVDKIKVDSKTVEQWHGQLEIRHTEYRDDRFAAAVFLRANQAARLFYAARAITPGKYLVPPALVEDMYTPDIRGVGESVSRIEISNP